MPYPQGNRDERGRWVSARTPLESFLLDKRVIATIHHAADELAGEKGNDD